LSSRKKRTVNRNLKPHPPHEIALPMTADARSVKQTATSARNQISMT
jgi:hypothetical protein